ncbi:MAG TPA: twin-arginine translocase subunit TatC, partial [Candidatus Saccharimonadia bacterium]|nr:twin-arginine translocase subunit TatC [Candidatus Saccharimonadia bacterium]
MTDIELGRGGEPGPSVPDALVADGSVMTLVDHLGELRRRVAVGAGALVVGTIIGFIFSEQLISLLTAPIGGQRLIYLELGGAFTVRLKLAVMVGVALALPIVVWQLWAFVAPGLTRRERQVARPWIPAMLVFFAIGVIVAYAILPAAATFLTGFEIPGVLVMELTADAYFGFVTMLFLVFGAVMQFPIVIIVLNRLGILPLARLKASRRYALLGIVIFAVVVTPGGDPISPTVMSAVMYALYEGTILAIGRLDARDAAARAAEPAEAAAGPAEAAQAAQAAGGAVVV